MEDQNATDLKPEGRFIDAFRYAIITIGRTVLVLCPLSAAIPLTRAWCVWEIFCRLHSGGTELAVALPPSEFAEFERVLLSGGLETIASWVTAVKAASSVAFVVDDTAKIHQAIREQFGFHAVDSEICAGLRGWLQQAALGVANGPAAGEEDAAMRAGLAGRLLSDQGKLGEAEPLLRRALEGKERTLGPDHSDTLISVNNLASLLKAQGKLGEAEPLLRRALEGQERALGPDDSSTLTSVNNLARLLQV